MEGKVFPYATVESSVSPGVWVGLRSAGLVVSLELSHFWGGSSSAEPSRPPHTYLVCTSPSPCPHDGPPCPTWEEVWIDFVRAVCSAMFVFLRGVCSVGRVRLCLAAMIHSCSSGLLLFWTLRTDMVWILNCQRSPCDLWWKLGSALASSSSFLTSFWKTQSPRIPLFSSFHVSFLRNNLINSLKTQNRPAVLPACLET